MYKWQILRIERVRATEPEQLEHALRTAQDSLARHARQDAHVYVTASRNLKAIREIKPFEIGSRSAIRTLKTDTEELRGQLNCFAEGRRSRIIHWSDHDDPGVRDAVVAAGVLVAGKVMKPVQAVRRKRK